jgi:hypothetical protein
MCRRSIVTSEAARPRSVEFNLHEIQSPATAPESFKANR